MSKMKHSSLTGLLSYDLEKGYLIDGFPVGDALDEMDGLEVQFELVGYQKSPTQAELPTNDDIVRKLLGGE
jgi:hypothetical protein